MSIWEKIRERSRESAEEAIGLLKKHRRILLILAVLLVLAIPAYAGYIYLSNILSAGPITVGQVQSMQASWNPAPPSSVIQYQNGTFGVNVNNPNALALNGKWVVEVDKAGITVDGVDVYMKGPGDSDYFLLTNKIQGTDKVFIESPIKTFLAQTTQTWNFKIKFNVSGQIDSVKVYIVDPSSTP
ncbi:MAG: hypothetical protein QXP38_00175 [Nitrososphaerota archaeon]